MSKMSYVWKLDLHNHEIKTPQKVTSFNLSKYLLGELFLGTLDSIDTDSWIICVGYEGKYNDVQIGVTGKPLFRKDGKKYWNETPSVGAQREFYEEARMYPNEMTLVTKEILRGKEIFHFQTHIKNCEVKPHTFESGKDNFRKKLTVVVHGPEDDIVSRLSEIDVDSDLKNDSITYIMAMPKVLVLKLIERINSDSSKKPVIHIDLTEEF